MIIHLRQRVRDQQFREDELQRQVAEAKADVEALRTRAEIQMQSQQEWNRIHASNNSVEQAVNSLNENLQTFTTEHTISSNQLYEIISIMEGKFQVVLENFVKKSRRVLDAVAQAHSNTAGVPVTRCPDNTGRHYCPVDFVVRYRDPASYVRNYSATPTTTTTPGS